MTTELNSIDSIKNDIWRLNKKADQMRSFHGDSLDRLRTCNTISTIYVTIGSAIGTTITFAEIPDKYFLYSGIFSASVFFVSLLPSALNINKLIEERAKALNLYSMWIRDAQHFANNEIADLTMEQRVHRHRELTDLYKNIGSQTISINNNRFNKLKQKHLQKIAISKELDKNPFESMRDIRKRLSEEYKIRQQ